VLTADPELHCFAGDHQRGLVKVDPPWVVDVEVAVGCDAPKLDLGKNLPPELEQRGLRMLDLLPTESDST
jgi:hypothetical protein